MCLCYGPPIWNPYVPILCQLPDQDANLNQEGARDKEHPYEYRDVIVLPWRVRRGILDTSVSVELPDCFSPQQRICIPDERRHSGIEEFPRHESSMSGYSTVYRHSGSSGSCSRSWALNLDPKDSIDFPNSTRETPLAVQQPCCLTQTSRRVRRLVDCGWGLLWTVSIII